jgi:hypothetical protein
MSDNWDTPTDDDGGFMGGDAYPALAFSQIGDTHEGVVKAVKRQQDVDYKTKAPLTWPGGDPKYVYLFEIEQPSGEMGTAWVRGNAVKVIREAVKAAGATSPVGWNLKLQHHALAEAKDGLNPAKLYRAKITPAAVRQAVPADLEEPF